ncbi:hypothetical protein Tco_0702392 [Tanacetum coccineum]|uniref:Uncharacterized protein n=1 Tax=Tanacetum coccineum TaxID=301880 RepID=A0ABQ4XWG7_9ASTR
MPPKRTSTSETPAITLAAIRQLINDGISSALKAQAASMASASNPNKNTGTSGTPVARKGINDHKRKFEDRGNTTNNNNYPKHNNNNHSNNRNNNNYQDNNDLNKLVLVHVMAALVISISSDTSEESVGSHAPQVILFGAIPAIIPTIPEVPIVLTDPIVSPEVRAILVVSPTRVLDLVDYSSSSYPDPSKDSLPPVPDLPLVSPFLCSDDSEADDQSKLAEQRPERHESLTIHDAKVSRWRDRVTSRPSTPSGPSSHDILAPSFEFPLAPIVALPGIRRLRPLPARRLAWRHVPYHLSDHHSSPESSSSSSSSDPSLVHSSACDSSGQAHSRPSTRDRATPLSTPYPPTTSESSLGSSSERSLDSSSPSSRPSRKRCRSPTASVPSSTHVLRSISLTPVDLLPPCKRFRDSYSPEDNGDEHMEVDMGVEVVASDIREDEEEFEAEAGEADTREIAVDLLATRDVSESTGGDVPDHGIADGAVIESVQRFQGHRIARVDLGVTTMTERLSILEQDNVRLRDTLGREKEVVATYEEAHAANAFETENQSQNGSDCDNGNDGNGNGGNGNGRNENPNENGRGDRQVAR